MKKILLTLIAICFLGACSHLPFPLGPSICDTVPQGDSVLCDITTKNDLHLEAIGDILMVANLRAIKGGTYTADEAKEVFEKFRLAINTELSTAMLKDQVMRYVADYPELLLVSGYLNYLDSVSVQLLKPKDVELLNSWIDKQISMMGE